MQLDTGRVGWLTLDLFGRRKRSRVIPDNTKAIVSESDPLEPKLVLGFLEYVQSRGFHVGPTRVGAPRDKARFERSVQTVQDDCYGGEEPCSIEEARLLGRTWCLEEHGLRCHSTTQRLPREHFETEELPTLLKPPSEPYDVALWSEPKVSPDQHAQVAKALYSLPRVFRGRKLRARADKHTGRMRRVLALLGLGRAATALRASKRPASSHSMPT